MRAIPALLGLVVLALAAAACGPAEPVEPVEPPPVAVACDPVRITPAPALTCEAAISSATPRLLAIGFRQVTALTFEYGAWCPPDGGCPPFSPEVGHVLVEFGDGSRPMAVDVAFEAGRIRASDPEPVPEWWPGDQRVDGPGLDR